MNKVANLTLKQGCVMSIFNSFYRWLLGPAGRQGQLSDLDAFIHAFESQRKEEPQSRKQERLKAASIAALRDGTKMS